jgi:hypothetical protein
VLLAAIVGWRWVSRTARDADPQTAPLEWREKMLQKFEGETLLQAVENLHDVGDWAWASTSYPDGVGPTAFFRYCNRVPPRLTRVRRILGETQAGQRAGVIRMLESQLDRPATATTANSPTRNLRRQTVMSCRPKPAPPGWLVKLPRASIC